MKHTTLSPPSPTFDLVCIGRAAVDLYGEQLGSRLEDMQSFAKYLGGSSANMAYGASRLGLRVAMLTRVGDEHMGRFVREELSRGGVDVTHVKTDPSRLTGVVILGIKNRDTFPLIFYRENCADMALCEEDIDPALIANSRAIAITGTHFSTPGTDAACRRAIAYARQSHTRVVLDIDYRPVLWGLTGRGDGEQRYVSSQTVTAHLQSILPLCDLIVGTEEEIQIAGGSTDLVEALQCIRQCTTATVVVKHGARGASVFEGTSCSAQSADPLAVASSSTPSAMPTSQHALEATRVPGYPADVLNVLGAGDAFMAGFLSGWLRNAPVRECARLGNACGAIVVTRHSCSSAMPTATELQTFLDQQPHDVHALARVHWGTTRVGLHTNLCILAFDHRRQLIDMAEKHGAPITRISALKACIARAALNTLPGLAGRAQAGILVDDRFGQAVLEEFTGKGLWIGRPIELPTSRPLTFEAGPDLGLQMRAWPKEHVAKCLVWYHPDDAPELMAQQIAALKHAYEACQRTEHVFLLEVIPPAQKPLHHGTTPTTTHNTPSMLLPRAMEQIYRHGIFPDWWKLPTPTQGDGEWEAITQVIQQHDPYCYGVLLLGLDAPLDVLSASLQHAAQHPICKGFAVGRTLFSAAAQAWFAGTMDDDALISQIADNYLGLADVWCTHRRPTSDGTENTQ